MGRRQWKTLDAQFESKKIRNTLRESVYIIPCSKGNSPDFHHAMASSESKAFFEKFVDQLKAAYDPDLVKVGSFGEYMQVNITGDGPVTIQLESPNKNSKSSDSINV